MQGTKSQESTPNPIAGYFRDFGVLRETRSEYWGIQIINILDCIAYFSMLAIATLFLSENLGMSDQSAGRVYAIFTSATMLLLTFSGAICDWLGIRRSLRVSMWSMFVLRAMVVVVGVSPNLPYRGVIAAVLLVAMAPFMAGIQTIFQAATQRFTTTRSRSAGFNLWYLFMNIGAMIGGISVDYVRLTLKISNVHIFSLGVVTALLCVIVAESMVRKEAQLQGAGEETVKAPEVVVKKSPLQTLREVVREPAFLRLVVLIALVLGVRAVYTYNFLLMPKYWVRTIGPDAQIGTLNAINPLGIVIGLIVFIPLANKFRVFSMLVYGSMVSAFALVPMALPWEWYGMDIARAHYAMAIACMVILTIGEVLWSPKLYEYTALLAPKGQEGTYLGLSMVPWFFAKTVVSWFSGDLLVRWSPETVQVDGAQVPLQQALIAGQVDYWHSPSAMWLWLGIWAMGGCVLALFLRPWLTKGVRGEAVAG